MTALMRASSQGDEACAAELIGAGASVDARDSQEGFTALLMASAMGARAPLPPTRARRTLLHPPCPPAAAPALFSRCVSVPLSLSSPLLCSPSRHGLLRRPLAGHLGVVRRLLAAEADVNARNNDGATALMLATYAQKEQVVRSLIGSGARQGLTAALAFAEQAEQGALASMLREALPSSSSNVGWLGWLGWSTGSDSLATFDLGFLPLCAPPAPLRHPAASARRRRPRTLAPSCTRRQRPLARFPRPLSHPLSHPLARALAPLCACCTHHQGARSDDPWVHAVALPIGCGWRRLPGGSSPPRAAWRAERATPRRCATTSLQTRSYGSGATDAAGATLPHMPSGRGVPAME